MDLIGCEDTLTITIEEPDAPLSVNIDQINVTCFEAGNGSITATPSGGYAPYTYLWWETNTTDDNLQNLTPGTYNLSVMDSGECVVNTSITITQPELLEGYTNVTNVDCYGNATGTAIGTILGGTSPFVIDWSTGAKDTNKVNTLSVGQYKMFVTDANDCLDTVIFNVNQPDSIDLELNQVDVNCFGESNGSLLASVSGGTPVYNYKWDNSAVIANQLTNLSAGNYGVLVTDAKGCEKYIKTKVLEPDEFVMDIINTDPLCFNNCDGSIEVQTDGGVYPYTYSIGQGNKTDSIFNGLCPNNYTVIATDANGCQIFELLVPIVAPDTFKIISADKTDLLCKEICDGKIDIVANQTSSYAIVPGNGFGSSPNFEALCDGVYDVYARNDNGCTDSIKSLTLTAPPLITFTIPKDTSICLDGTATFELNGDGGSGALKYYVNGNDTNTTGIFDFTLTKDTILYFTIVDENGCSPLTPIIANVTVGDSLRISAFEDVIICAQDSTEIYALGEGGNGNLTYNWNNGTSDISNDSALIVKPITTTNYTVTLNDGCETPAVSDQVIIEVLEYPDFTINKDAENYCTPTDVIFWLESDEIEGYDINWKFNNQSVSQAIRDTIEMKYLGNYNLTLNLTSPQGCNFKFQEDSFIQIKPYPIAEMSISSRVKKITDPNFKFTNESSHYNSIEWIIDETRVFTDEEFTVNLDSIKCYPVQLVAMSDAGCTDTTTSSVCVEDIFKFVVPSGFTPNGDGINEGFIPQVANIDVSTFNFWVFDRWGEQIYHTKNPNEPWNGRRNNTMRDAQIDVYVWVFEANDIWGFRQYRVGTISLIR